MSTCHGIPRGLNSGSGESSASGQARRTVDMLNLVYHDTQDERVYQVISRRMKDRYDIFGGLPDTIEDDWIQTVEELEDMMDEYIHLRNRHETFLNCDTKRPSTQTRIVGNCARGVLARSDVIGTGCQLPW